MSMRESPARREPTARTGDGQQPPRDSLVSRLCESLARWCRERPVHEKWLIAPSLRIGNQWLDTVAVQGQPVLNCRVKTLKGMALEQIGSDMAVQGVSLVSSTGSLMLMDAILHQLPQTGYLASLPASPGLARAILSAVNALRMAGMGADNLDASCFDEPAKADDIKYVLVAYIEALRQRNLVDYTDVLRMAERSVRDRGLGDVLVLMPEDEDLTARELALIRSIPENTVHWLAVDRPARTKGEAEADETDARLLRWLSVPTEAPEPRVDGTAAVFHASGEINEVREALRRCLAAGYNLDQVELLHTDKQTYVPLIFETFLRMTPHDHEAGASVPVTFAEGIPAMYAKPGRALAGWIQWIREDYPQTTLARLMEDGLVQVPGMQEAGLSLYRLAAILKEVRIGWGKDRYVTHIDERITALQGRIAGEGEPEASTDEDSPSRVAPPFLTDEDRIAGLRVLRDLVERLLDITPAEMTAPLQVLEAAKSFVSSFARADNEMDNYATRALKDNIKDLSRWLADIDGPVSLDVWQWLAALPSSVWIMGSGPRPGRLHVAGISSGGFSGRKHTFVIGLEDGRFPGTALNDPVLLDSEREKISENLPTAREQLGRSVERFVRLLAGLRGTVTLGFSSFDLKTDRSLFPSPVVFAAFRILSGNRTGDQSHLLQWLGLPASFAPAEEGLHLDETEWWLWRLCGRERLRDPLPVIDRRFPHLARGRLASEERYSERFTAYDGRIPEMPEELDPFAQSGPIMSSAMLETVGACALRYFFKYILEIRPVEQLELDPTRWLDPIQFGNLLHDVFYRFVSELISQRRSPSMARDMGRLTAILEQNIDRYARMFPSPGPSVFRQQSMQLFQSARIFLTEEEILSRSQRPRFVEVSVGMSPRGNGGPADTGDPVTVAAGSKGSIRVRGRIDRIDAIGDDEHAEFAVCDYKTGSDYRYTKQDLFWEGRVIQHALYLAVAANVLTRQVTHNAKVMHFEYYFPQHRGRGRRLRITPEQVDAGTAIVANLCRLVSEGSFLPTIEARDDCGMCDYRSVCGDVKSITAWARRKIDNPENSQLEPLRELRNCGDMQT
jgi:hypothetical protein